MAAVHSVHLHDSRFFSSADRIFQHGWWWRTWLFTPLSICSIMIQGDRGNSLRRPPSHPSDTTIMPPAPLHTWTRVFHPEQKLYYSLEWVSHLALDYEPRTMAWDFKLLTFFCAASLTAANHPDVSRRSQRKPTETNQSRSITPRPPEWIPASLWLCLEILPIKVMKRIWDKGQTNSTDTLITRRIAVIHLL